MMVVQCTWKTSDGKDVTNAVIWTSDESKLSTNLEDEVEAENCHLLIAPNTGSSEYLTVPACQLLLSCQPPDQINYLSILSEAKVLELYGHHGEYVETIRNMLLDEVDDIPIYRGDIKLTRPLQVCSIKFASLKTKDEMWLYGVKAITSKAKEIPDNALKIQFSEVEHRLQDMGLELSERAEAFKQLVLSHQQNVSKFDAKDLTNFVQAFGLLNLAQNRTQFAEPKLKTSSNSVEDIAADICNENSERMAMNSEASESASVTVNGCQTVSLQSSSTQTDNLPLKSDLDDMKAHLDEKFVELEKQMIGNMQKQFQEIETKLLCKLDEIEYFVKPHGVEPKI